MLKLIKCECLKLKRKPLVFISVFLSALLPLAYAIFLADANTDVDATNNMMAGLFSSALSSFDAASCDTGFQSAV
ncbi:MAG: ABC transporter permease [Enterocloster sp.]